MVRPTRSLSATITLYLGGGLLALDIGLGLALTWGIGAWLDRAVRAQTQTLATQLATVSLDAVLISDYGTLERYLLDLATQPGIRALRIQRADGEILGEAGAPPDLRPAAGVVWAKAPVQLGASRIGEVLVGYDASATDIGLMWTAGLLVASGALYLGLRRTLQRRLVQPAEQLAARLCDFAETGEIEWDDLPRELARVVRTFEDLCRRLAESGRQRVEASGWRAERPSACVGSNVSRASARWRRGWPTVSIPRSAISSATPSRRAGRPRIRRSRDVIEEQAKVCAALVRHLLDSVRPPEAHPRALDLMPRIEATVALMEPVLRDRGIARIQVAGEIANPVWADPSCVEQVLFNLLTNASEAGAHQVAIALDEDAGQARLTLTDDGQGIPEAIRTRLFEPFVSGKPPGKGTALGLHLCQTLLRSVGGDIVLLDTGPAGTRFRIAWRSLTPENHR